MRRGAVDKQAPLEVKSEVVVPGLPLVDNTQSLNGHQGLLQEGLQGRFLKHLVDDPRDVVRIQDAVHGADRPGK